MNKDLAKRMAVAAILTSWLFTPISSAFANDRVVVDKPNQNVSGVSDQTGNMSGGAVANGGYDNLTITGDYINNHIEADTPGTAVFGGAIYQTGGSISINNATFDNNSASGFNQTYPGWEGVDSASGGAIYIAGATGNSTITNTTFNNNHALTNETSGNGQSNGGAIYFESNKGTIEITGGSFTNNSSVNRGGAVYNGDSVLTFDGTTFEGNKATNGSGGAIYSLETNNANTTLNNSTFTGNSAEKGGAIANYSGEINSTNTNYTGNIATSGNGGAIFNETYVNTSVVNINGGTFSGNKAENGLGGAIYNSQEVNISSDDGNVLFTGNADSKGANDIYMNSSSAELNLSGSTNSVAFESGIAGSGNINSTAEDLILSGDNSKFNGTFTQNGGNTTVKDGGIFFDGTNNITDGSVLFEEGAALAGQNVISGNGSIQINNGVDLSSGSISFDDSAQNNGEFVLNNDNSETAMDFAFDITGNTGTVKKTGAGDLNLNKDYSTFTGNFETTEGNINVKQGFFGGTSNINGGSVHMENGSSLVSGSTVNIENDASLELKEGTIVNEGATVNINSGNVTVDTDANAIISGVINATGSGILVNNGNLLVTGENASLTGNIDQSYDDATITIAENASLDVDRLDAGKLIIDGGKLADDLEITEAVDLQITGGATVIDGDGLKVGDYHIKNAADCSLNISGDYIVDGGILGTSVIISNGSINAINPEGDVTVNEADRVLTLSDNATSNHGYKIEGDATLKLAPTDEGSLTLAENNKVTGDGTVLVEQIVIEQKVKNPAHETDPSAPEFITEKIAKGVGNINIESDNRDFVGEYIQNDGTVLVKEGGVFFGGTNNINTVEDTEFGGYNSGELVLDEGALLASDVNINGLDDADVVDLAAVKFNGKVTGSGEDGAITQSDIESGVFNHAAIDDSTKTVNVNKAGAVFSNGQIIDENITLASDKGVRLIGFGNGSGVNGDITLGDKTGLLYFDGAHIKDDSTLNMTNADLIFANSENLVYNPEITGSGTISMWGNGSTSIVSALNEDINLDAQGGTLNIDNTATTAIGDVNAEGGTVNVKASEVKVGNVTVSNDGAEGGSVNFTGNVTGTDATLQENGSLGLFGQSSFNNINLGAGSLNMMGNNVINNVTVGNLNLTENSNILFDVNPRTNAMDSINATTINADGNQLLVTGINFTQSPIDRNVTFDISNLVQQNGQSQADLVKLPDGGVIANSAMGQYLITSSGGSSPILNAGLLALNPQMYRGQVATIASWQNQLIVNNLLFDHMNLVTRKLMDDEKTANKYAAALPQIDPYQYSVKDGSLWYKAYGAFETLSMTKGLNVGNNAYGSVVGADFPLINLSNGWKLVPTAYIAYNGGHQHFNGVSMYQNGAQLGFMGTAYKGDFMTSLLAYGGGYANDMSVRGQYGSGSDTTGNWFAGVASKSAYNFHLPYDFIFQPTFMAAYNAFGQQNWGSNFGTMSMSSGMLNGLNIAPGMNLIWQKKTFSIYATAQLVYNVMGGVDGKAGNIDLGYVRMRHCYFEYGLGVMKKFKDRFSGYLQFTIRNGGRTGIGFSGGLQWKIGK